MNWVVDLPIETKSEANTREHWSRKATRTKKQRKEAFYLCREAIGALNFTNNCQNLEIEVILTRLAPIKLDSDNLAGAFKAIRDGIADFLQMDDGDERIRWEYQQEKLSKTRCARANIAITYEVL